MFVIPSPGLIVLDPLTMRPLPPEGADVPDCEHWQRRLRDGDVTARAAKPPRKRKPTTAPADGANNQ